VSHKIVVEFEKGGRPVFGLTEPAPYNTVSFAAPATTDIGRVSAFLPYSNPVLVPKSLDRGSPDLSLESDRSLMLRVFACAVPRQKR
jgi:hypothetical protein